MTALLSIGLFFNTFTIAHAADIKIGFVNILKVLDAAPQAKRADSRLKKEFAPREKELAKLGEDITRLESRLRQEKDILGAQKLTKLRQSLRSKRREFERQQDEIREDFNVRRNQEINKLQKDIFKAIVALAEEGNYDLIAGEGVIYASKQIDITDKVLGRLK
jgi:outer membrane protein